MKLDAWDFFIPYFAVLFSALLVQSMAILRSEEQKQNWWN